MLVLSISKHIFSIMLLICNWRIYALDSLFIDSNYMRFLSNCVFVFGNRFLLSSLSWRLSIVGCGFKIMGLYSQYYIPYAFYIPYHTCHTDAFIPALNIRLCLIVAYMHHACIKFYSTWLDRDVSVAKKKKTAIRNAGIID